MNEFDKWLHEFWRSQEYWYLRRRFAHRAPRSSRERKTLRRLSALAAGG